MYAILLGLTDKSEFARRKPIDMRMMMMIDMIVDNFLESNCG